MLKYIEIHSHNSSHIHEVFRQCVRAIVAARESNPEMKPKDYDREYVEEHDILRGFLVQTDPGYTFDPASGELQFTVPAGSVVLYTPDGNEPTRASNRYNGPLRLSKPYPRVRAAVMTRCKYNSQAQPVEFPLEGLQGDPHFDPLHSRFVVPGASAGGSTRFYYTLDGTRPSAASNECKGAVDLAGVPSGGQPLALLVDGPSGAQVKSFALPARLSAPHVTIDIQGVVRIEPTAEASTQGAVEYRYTLDGTPPTEDST